jgi:hypothetical protein
VGQAGDQMTDENQPAILAAFNRYLQAAYVPHPTDYWAALHIRSFAKWWMDLCRNFIVVAVLQFFAQRSGSLALKVFADITFLVFLAYCSSHFNNWHFFFFPYIRNHRLKLAVNMVLWLIVYGLMFYGAIIGVALVYAELVKVQVR